MQLKLEQRAGWDIVRVEGAMMMTRLTHVPPIFTVLGEKKGAKVALDLAQTDAMDSGALAILIGLRKQVAANAGRLVIVAPSEEVRVLFGIVGFDEGLTVFDTRREFQDELRSHGA